MAHWLLGMACCLGSYLAFDLGVLALLRLVHRVWGDRGLAWVLGKPEAEVARMRSGPAP